MLHEIELCRVANCLAQRVAFASLIAIERQKSFYLLHHQQASPYREYVVALTDICMTNWFFRHDCCGYMHCSSSDVAHDFSHNRTFRQSSVVAGAFLTRRRKPTTPSERPLDRRLGFPLRHHPARGSNSHPRCPHKDRLIRPTLSYSERPHFVFNMGFVEITTGDPASCGRLRYESAYSSGQMLNNFIPFQFSMCTHRGAWAKSHWGVSHENVTLAPYIFNVSSKSRAR